MSVEFGRLTDRLYISPEARTIIQVRDNAHFQTIEVVNNEEFGSAPSLIYTFHLDSIWGKIHIFPDFRSTTLRAVTVGRSLGASGVHDIQLILGDERVKYYAFLTSPNRPPVKTEKDLGNVDWAKLGDAKRPEFYKASTNICKDPETGLASFAYRIIPASNFPLIQISLTERFSKTSTLSVDMAYAMTRGVFDHIYGEGDKIVASGSLSAEEEVIFSDALQIAFSRYFPMHLRY